MSALPRGQENPQCGFGQIRGDSHDPIPEAAPPGAPTHGLSLTSMVVRPRVIPVRESSRSNSDDFDARGGLFAGNDALGLRPGPGHRHAQTPRALSESVADPPLL